MNSNPTKISALVSLLQDDNPRVVSLAMEQMLELGPQAQSIIAEHQETTDPVLRTRIHQLSAIFARRAARQRFLQSIREENMSAWDGVVEINALCDPDCNRRSLSREIAELASELSCNSGGTPSLATFMREQNFAVPEEDLLDADLYLLGRVLETRYGAPPLLCALAQRLGRVVNWHSTVVLYEGRFCLIDAHGMLLDPSPGWRVSRLSPDRKIHPCGRKDLWLSILSQVLLVALVEGNLRDLYHISELLTALDNIDMERLPFPLGAGKSEQ